MKQFFVTIKESIYSPAYYRALLTKPFGYSWKYYSTLALLIATFLTMVSSVPLVMHANTFVHEFPEKFFAYYPDDFEVRIAGGVLTTNVVEPYVLPVPEVLRDVAQKDGITALVVFDTTTPFSLERFNAEHALMWVGKDEFAYRDQGSSVRLERYESGTDLTINEGLFRHLESLLSPYYRLVGPMIVVIIFLGILVFLGLNFIYLIFGAVPIFFLLRFLKQPVTYGKAYQVGLHAITLPLLLQMLLSITPVPFFGLPFVMTATLLVVVFVNYRDTGIMGTEALPTVVEKVGE